MEDIVTTIVASGIVASPVATGGNLINDESKHWTADCHKNKILKIVNPNGSQLVGVIDHNGENTLLVHTAWTSPIVAGANYYILASSNIGQALRDVLGGGADINAANPLEVHDPKVGSLISYEGTTTADGAALGASLICAGLAAEADFDGCIAIITSGAYSGQPRDIDGTTLAGTVTPNRNFGGVIVAGTSFVIAAITTTPAEVAALTALVNALMTDIGDASAATLGSILAILGDPAQSFLAMIGYEGALSLANKLTAARAGYLDELDFDLQDALSTIQTDLDNPDQYKADIAALALEATLGTHDTDIKNLLAIIAGAVGLTTFGQETVAPMDVNGTTWKDLLDKSVIIVFTKLCGFNVAKAGGWAGNPKIRIVDGAGTKIFPHQDEYEDTVDFTVGEQVIFNIPVEVPIADGYKFQFRSTNAADGAGETLALTSLDIVEVG